MNLLVDSGNSFIKWVWVNDESFIAGGRCLTTEVSSLHEKWADNDVPVRVLVSNVAGVSAANEISKAVSVLWQLEVEFIVSSQNCCGLTNSYHKPGQLGVDRWMAMVAAYRMTQNPVIVVDCGTAVTIDLVNEKGLFIGGVIMPGLMAALQSLKLGTDAVEDIGHINSSASPASQSTEEGVITGVLLGLAGGIERVVREQSLLIDMIPTVLISGGDREKIASYLTIPVVLQPELVLEGMRVFASQRPETED
ncbi:MAG: type III pantothenate kinase [Arenicellales bacterium]